MDVVAISPAIKMCYHSVIGTCKHIDGLPSCDICHVFVRRVFLCIY